MKKLRCKFCGIDAKYGVEFVNGLCGYCRNIKKISKTEVNKYAAQLKDLVNDPKNKKGIIVALSGGKDSSYTLLKLREEYEDAKIYGVQFDNGFLSENAIENAKKMCELTNSEYVVVNVDQKKLNDLFKKASVAVNPFGKKSTLRASDLCTVCIGIVKQKLFNLALEKKINLVAFGWTPGQSFNPIIKLTKEILNWNRSEFENNLDKIGCLKKSDFLIDSELIESMNSPIFLIHPLSLFNYDEKKIIRSLKEVGWMNPKDTDSNSTNCMLNAYAVENHISKYGLHPYALEIHGLIRNKFMSKKDGLKKLEKVPPIDNILSAKKRLGLNE